MKIDLKESLNELDIISDNRYDLYNIYLSKNPSIGTKKKLAEAIYKNKSPKEIALILKEDWDDAAWHDTADQEQVDQPDYFPDGEEESEWTEMDSKSVRDSDGFLTDYTWYWRNNNGEDQHVFVFGDSDLYGPEDGYFDWECDSLEEAQEWFENYVGPGDEDDDWMDESLKEAKFIEPKYRDGDVVFVGDANGYHGSFLIEGDIKNIPKELYKCIHKITKYGNLDKPYYKVEYKLDSDHLFEEDYRKFFGYIIPVLKNAGITIIDKDDLMNESLNEDSSDTYNYDKYYLRKRSFIRQYSLNDILSFLHSKGYDINNEETKEYAKGVQDYMNWVDKSYDEPPKSLEDWYEDTMFNYPDDLDELPKINESLDEAMVKVEPTEKELNQVINVLTKYGFKVDDNYKPGRGLFGSYHIQVINPDLDYIDFDQLVADVGPLGDALDNLSFDINMPITYNFGSNDDGVITGGIDIHVGYKDDGIDESLKEDLNLDDFMEPVDQVGKAKIYYDSNKRTYFTPSLDLDFETLDQAKDFIGAPLYMGESLNEEKSEDEFVTKKDVEAAKLIIKKSTNPKEIKKAQGTIKKYKDQNK